MGCVIGAGLVGCFLGAAGGFPSAICGPSGVPASEQVLLPSGERRRWRPALVAQAVNGPLLVACRAGDTPLALVQRPGSSPLLAQNGLGQRLPTAACFMALDREADGLLRATGPRPRLVLADPGPDWTPILNAWRAAGISIEVVADATAARWEKCILNATVGPLCLALDLGMAAVWAEAQWRALVLAATTEGEAIAAAAGIALPPGLGERAAAFFAAAGDHRPSCLRDPRELAWVLDPLLATARQHALAAPALSRIAELVGSRVGP